MNTNEIRKITTHFNNLQGLKSLPIGVYFLLLAAINLGWLGPLKDRGLLMAILALALLCSVLIQAVYNRRHGKVVQTRRYHVREIVFVLAAVILIFLTILLDSILTYNFGLKLSLQGLAWAIFFFSFAWWIKRVHFAIYGMLFVALSFLPLLGGVDKAWLFDYTQGYIGWILLGLSMIVGGVVDHLYLVNNLRADAEVKDGASI
ncbi:hypothetical protein LARV_03923 [Longilinea arvoryzae]|uniref:Uncharacterized protein n=1 Tax=Longilinea arvoryzae TaxID=360412 RepID=A0A0K8MZP7_9CHLR|nr:hypothetical protein [Longilinea arvoryzae]GAP16127.1 hypothetical protein LARV_03923 [Longilinea arvoryzae]